jgi:hypothetical protein
VSLGGGGVAGWSAAGWVAVPVIAAFAADAVSAAYAGVIAIAIASGLTAAAKRQREEMVVIRLPLCSGHARAGT